MQVFNMFMSGYISYAFNKPVIFPVSHMVRSAVRKLHSLDFITDQALFLLLAKKIHLGKGLFLSY